VEVVDLVTMVVLLVQEVLEVVEMVEEIQLLLQHQEQLILEVEVEEVKEFFQQSMEVQVEKELLY
jgi:hypothetical protein